MTSAFVFGGQTTLVFERKTLWRRGEKDFFDSICIVIMIPKVYLISLGCPKNLVDSERLANVLAKRGLELTTKPAQAAVVVVNTCSFIGEATDETLGELAEACRWKRRGDIRYLAAVGCLVSRFGKSFAIDYPEVDIWLSVNRENELAKKLAEALGLKSRVSSPASQGPYTRLTPKHYAYLKISEGCNNHCSYCALPKIRGGLKSRSTASLVREARFYIASGVRELNLVAEDSTAWGEDLYGRPSLPILLRALIKVPGLEWIRLLYCYPSKTDDQLMELLAANGALLPYLDMPIQGANDKVLKLMGRGYKRRDLLALVGRLRDRVPGICLRTTVITGFPGEGKREFESTMDFISKVGFDRLGVFKYSSEEGTPAAALSGAVPEQEKENRFHQLMQAQLTISKRWNEKYVGSEMTLLAEDKDWGRSYRDAPEIDGKVMLRPGEIQKSKLKIKKDEVRSRGAACCAQEVRGRPGERRMKAGEFYRVKIIGAAEYDLHGELVENSLTTTTRR